MFFVVVFIYMYYLHFFLGMALFTLKVLVNVSMKVAIMILKTDRK